jgi:ribulose-5-phosphate 4-epimerase/fuculose-1-phosphate aldolase
MNHQNRRCKLTESQAREEICRVGQSLFERGYVHATAGNISVKLDADQGGGYLITPTDACLGFLDPARLARLDAEGRQLSGDRASKTIVLHQRIYLASAGSPTAARCIIHTHSTHCVALTLGDMHSGQRQPLMTSQELARELLPALTPYFVMKVGHVPLIDYHRPGDPQAAQAVAVAIASYQARGTSIRAVMLKRLGPNVWHDSPAAAMATLEELEETARLWHLTQGLAQALPESDIAELRQTFGAFW